MNRLDKVFEGCNSIFNDNNFRFWLDIEQTAKRRWGKLYYRIALFDEQHCIKKRYISINRLLSDSSDILEKVRIDFIKMKNNIESKERDRL